MMTSFFSEGGLSRDDGRLRRGRGVKWRFLYDVICERPLRMYTEPSISHRAQSVQKTIRSKCRRSEVSITQLTEDAAPLLQCLMILIIYLQVSSRDSNFDIL